MTGNDKLKDRLEEDATYCDFYVGNEHSDKPSDEQCRIWVEKFHEVSLQRILASIEVMMASAQEDGDNKAFGIISQVHESLCEEYGVEQ